MKKIIILVIGLFVISTALSAQIVNSEMTVRWDETEETLIPEDGAPPPATGVDASQYLGRIRLQDKRNFPVLEVRYLMNNSYDQSDIRDLRLAGLVPLAKSGFFVKGIFVDQKTDDADASSAYAAYIMGRAGKINLAAGLDYNDASGEGDEVYSIRAKYKYDRFNFMAGLSSQPDKHERLTGGVLIDLPDQFMLGGLIGAWQDDLGYSFNVGRYNRRGDFDNLPSFSLNYLEVPRTYKWTNFRIMFGDAGAHYVRPTFDNAVFSGQLDLDAALMLSQLIPDNYRHFDSPLLFLRYDEYGSYALRINFIETETAFRKFDANFSCNPGWEYGIFKSNRAIVSFERLHNPAFGWQDNRYHFNVASYLFGKIYAGVTLSEDFDNYSNIAVEFRIQSAL